jgi:hypothetical protein
MENKKMIKVTSKRIFFRGLSIFVGGLIGGVLTREEINLVSITYLDNVIHFVMIFSAILRLSVWGVFLRSKNSQI